MGLSMALLVLMTGCGSDENPITDASNSTEDTTWQIEVINDVPVVTFEDGTIVEGWDAYQAGVAEHISASSLEDLSLSVRQWPDTTTEANLASWDFSIMGYYVRFSAESNPLGGCINRRVPHLGIQLSRHHVRQPIVNIHVAAWSQNGRPCVGIYNSGSKGYFCWKVCGPSYSDIRNALAAAIVAAGVGYVMAEILASVITPIACLLVL